MHDAEVHQETVLWQLTLTVVLVLRGVVQRGLARVEVVLVMMVVSVVASAGGLGVEDLRHLVITVNRIQDCTHMAFILWDSTR